LFGSYRPFDAAALADLYPNHGIYVSKVTRTTHDNLSNGFMEREDAMATVQEAAHSGIGRR
jgi:hypothetical protein